jgi:hypothetical protein
LKCQYFCLLIAFVASLFPIPSCSQQKSHRCQGTIEEKDGIQIIRNPQDPAYKGNSFSLVEELAIGYMERKEERIFTNINDVAVDADENIYLLDIRQGQISVFNKNGEYLRNIGKKGQGPGEFQFPLQILVSPNREFVICDLMLRRLLFFSLDGTFERSVPTWQQGRLTKLLIDSEGNIIGETMLSGEKRGFSLIKFNSFFKELFTIAVKEREKIPLIEDLAPRIIWIVSENGEIIWGDSEKYEISVLSRDGKLLKKIIREIRPKKVPEEEYREQIKSKFGEKPIPPEFEQQLPKYYPAFRSLEMDDQGRLFVSTYEKTKDGKNCYIDVFSPESKYIAKIPLQAQPRILKKGKLYTVEEDEKGYPVLKRYGIKWKID